MRPPGALLATVALAAGAAGLAGCGDKGHGNASGTGTATIARTVTTNTKVDVLERASGGAFNPQAIYAREAPGVVTVVSVFGGGGGILGGGGGEAGQGSGFVISGNGEIATNAHVVTDGEGSAIHKADEVYVQFADGNQVQAKIVGFDANADVALLTIPTAGLELRPLPLGDIKDVKVGEPVAAIGSPFGEPQSLSVGVVSALDRSIDSLTGFQISGAVQTDAAINPGNSGGPLLDGDGRVLGINAQLPSGGSGNGEGVGFAVPIDIVKRSLDALRKSGKVDYAFLGVSTTSVFPQLAAKFHLGTDHGAWVQSVSGGGPAAHAGIKGGSGPEQRFQITRVQVGGDVITQVNGKDVRGDSDLGLFLEAYQPGQTIPLTVQRGDKTRTVKVKLGERPATSRG